MRVLLFIGTTLLFLSYTMEQSANEFTSIDLSLSMALIACVLLIQTLIAFAFRKSTVSQRFVLALFLAINIFSLNLLLFPAIAQLPLYQKILVFCAATAVIYVLGQMCDDLQKIGKSLLALILVTTGILGIKATLDVAPHFNPLDKTTQSGLSLVPKITFKEKPNIYVVSFDSLTPSPVTNQYLMLENLPHQTYFKSHFRSFENFFADDVPTKPSLNSFLAFDRNHYRKMITAKANLRYFQGLSASPLLQTFKNNGYKTNTVFNSRYFGQIKGPYIDAYIVNKKTAACEFINEAQKLTVFFGYCRFINLAWINNLISPSTKLSDIDFQISVMRNALSDKTPNIFVSYLYTPGHTANTFKYTNKDNVEKYKKVLQKNSVEAAQYLERLVKFVDLEDPNGILFAFGDHGSYLSRGASLKDNKRFYILDRYAVLGGVYPKNRCDTKFNPPGSIRTPMQFAHKLLECLSGEPVNSSKFNAPILWSKKSGFEKPGSYSEFFYE